MFDLNKIEALKDKAYGQFQKSEFDRFSLERQIARLDDYINFVVCLRHGKWDKDERSLTTGCLISRISIDHNLIIDDSFVHNGIFIENSEIFLFGMLEFGEYLVAIKSSVRGGLADLILGLEKENSDYTQFFGNLPLSYNKNCLLVPPFYPLVPRSFTELYNFVQLQKYDLPTPLRDGFITLDEKNLKFLDTWKFMD
jgi:hypothetical protein